MLKHLLDRNLMKDASNIHDLLEAKINAKRNSFSESNKCKKEVAKHF